MPAHAPQRPRLPDFTGRPMTLPDGVDAWDCLAVGQGVLVLGAAPCAAGSLPFVQGGEQVFWLEGPNLGAVGQAWRAGLPAGWQTVQAADCEALARRCSIYFYRPCLRLAPQFWGPLLGRLQAALLCDATLPQAGCAANCTASGAGQGVGQGSVLLPGQDDQLLHQELRTALAECGLGPVVEAVPVPHGEDGLAQWRHLLASARPSLLLSVNLRGLDAQGQVFHLCQALGIPVVLWFVDNPWHLLSSLRLPWWCEALLCVTDASFVPGLRAAGARHVRHLPLAVGHGMWREPDAAGQGAPLFVGRSAFPDMRRFFAAARVPQALADEAAQLLAQSTGPDDGPHFHWWCGRLGVEPWPGQAVRSAGLGAERCARANRARWLQAAVAAGFEVVGDVGWQEFVPGLVPRPPVDYYTTLPTLYGQASAVLNVTSLLLPHSLSQRHFDVWAAGGFLFSDATPGLGIFPRELAQAITVQGPQELAARLHHLRQHPQWGENLRQQWREELRRAHGYAHRVRQILEDVLQMRHIRERI